MTKATIDDLRVLLVEDDPDVLHVTRTWQFLPGGELVDR